MTEKKTLFVTDLDGTLLNSNQTLSEYAKSELNKLLSNGLNLTFATARSFQTASKALDGLNWKLPAVFHNGVFIAKNDRKILSAEYLEREKFKKSLDFILSLGIRPIIYSVINGEEKFLFIESECNDYTLEFLNTRLDDPRRYPIENLNEFYLGDAYYITCIDDKERLEPVWEKIKDDFYTVFQNDLYSGKPWLEILPKSINKGKTLQKLKDMLGCERLISFGDSINDLEMFAISNEFYVPENAPQTLKDKATGVIESNENDGVIKWLLANGKKYED